jgi:hypothetical protein
MILPNKIDRVSLGPSSDLEDFARKATLLQIEGVIRQANCQQRVSLKPFKSISRNYL